MLRRCFTTSLGVCLKLQRTAGAMWLTTAGSSRMSHIGETCGEARTWNPCPTELDSPRSRLLILQHNNGNKKLVALPPTSIPKPHYLSYQTATRHIQASINPNEVMSNIQRLRSRSRRRKYTMGTLQSLLVFAILNNNYYLKPEVLNSH
jgi:hypothetical protein